MGKWGPVTFCNSKRWTKEAAQGVHFTVGNGYYITILHRNQLEELWKHTASASPEPQAAALPRE
jgi:hypothetical protein